MNKTAATDYFAPWTPEELGAPKATAGAVLLVGLLLALIWACKEMTPKPVPPAIQVTQAQLTQLPAPTPPPPPKVMPPQKPLPPVIHRPPPVPSRIVVATTPPPRHVFRPIPHPVVRPQPTPVPVQRPVQPPPPAAAAAPTSGIGPYGDAMHNILQANQNVPQALAQLGVSGTAVVQITVAPDGHVLSARIVTSSGVPLIDQTALDHALHANFGAFNADMPSTPYTFTVPIEIDGESGD